MPCTRQSRLLQSPARAHVNARQLFHPASAHHVHAPPGEPTPRAIVGRSMGSFQRAAERGGVLVHAACIYRMLPCRLCAPYHHKHTHKQTNRLRGGIDFQRKSSLWERRKEEERSIQAVYPEEMALGDDSPASYIRMVQHLIERCLTFGMSMEECMEALSKRADVQTVVTSTVWKELEKENKEFFDKYKQWRSEKGGVSSSS